MIKYILLILMSAPAMAQTKPVSIPADRLDEYYLCLTANYDKKVEPFKNRKGDVDTQTAKQLIASARLKCLKEMGLVE